jgi:hypothetical protein
MPLANGSNVTLQHRVSVPMSLLQMPLYLHRR